MRLSVGELRKLIRESLESVQAYPVDNLYHGTTRSRAEQIQKSGFSLKNIGEKLGAPMPGISTSVERSTAEDHAQMAAEKFEDDPVVITIDGRGLNIAPGSLYFQQWDETGSSSAALETIKDSGEWDGVALFDPETGDGIEEFEVLIFDPGKIRITAVR